MTRRTRAFTLIELLLVLFILAAVAATAASLGGEVDQQSRYDQTRARRELIRTAVLGDPAHLVDGQPVVSGFVADLGRLPTTLAELLAPPAPSSPAWRPCPPVELFPAGSFDPAGAAPRGAAQGAGWRGPYLRADLEHDAAGAELRTYRDGWRNLDPDPAEDLKDFGWDLEPGAAELLLHSRGSDGAKDVLPRGAEFSYTWEVPFEESPERRLVAPTDHLVDVGALVVQVRNTRPLAPGSEASLADVAVLVLAPDASSPTAIDWTTARQVSAALGSSSSDVVAPGELGPLRPATFAAPALVPWGRRSFVLVRAGGAAASPKLLGPIVTVTLLPRTSLPALTLELDTAP